MAAEVVKINHLDHPYILETVAVPFADAILKDEFTPELENLVQAIIGPCPTLLECFFPHLPGGSVPGPGERPKYLLVAGQGKKLWYGFPVPTWRVTRNGKDLNRINWPLLDLDETELGETEQQIHKNYKVHHRLFLVYTGKRVEWEWEEHCPDDCPTRRAAGGKGCKGANATPVDTHPLLFESISGGGWRAVSELTNEKICVGPRLCLCDSFFEFGAQAPSEVLTRWAEEKQGFKPTRCGPLSPRCKDFSADRLSRILVDTGLLARQARRCTLEEFVARFSWFGGGLWTRLLTHLGAPADMQHKADNRALKTWWQHYQVADAVHIFRSTRTLFQHCRKGPSCPQQW